MLGPPSLRGRGALSECASAVTEKNVTLTRKTDTLFIEKIKDSTHQRYGDGDIVVWCE